MKPEERAWAALRARASSLLRDDFAERAVRSANGPRAEVWDRLRESGGARLRPGFADRALRAARAAVEVPSLTSQLALSALTAAVCLAAVVFLHHRQREMADAHNLAEWQRIATIAQEIDSGGL